jgi:hypothetical protein
MKRGVETTPKLSFISNVPQIMDGVQHNTGISSPLIYLALNCIAKLLSSVTVIPVHLNCNMFYKIISEFYVTIF